MSGLAGARARERFRHPHRHARGPDMFRRNQVRVDLTPPISPFRKASTNSR